MIVLRSHGPRCRICAIAGRRSLRRVASVDFFFFFFFLFCVEPATFSQRNKLPGRNHAVAGDPRVPRFAILARQVAERSLFMMGDNRETVVSIPATMGGDRKRIVGKATAVWIHRQEHYWEPALGSFLQPP